MSQPQPEFLDPMVFTHVLSLLRFTVQGKPIPGQTADFCTEENLRRIYKLTKHHDLAHLVTPALESLKLPESDILQKFHGVKMQAIYRFARMDYEYQQICDILESAKIPFLPLKGAILRAYYPQPWMRTSCDIDILVNKETLDAATAALTSRGWTIRGNTNYHDISLYSATGVHLELHFHIKENMAGLDPVLETVWQHCSLAPGKQYEHRLSNDFFLFHHLAHMSYHFVSGGCGVRPFLDLWLLRQHMPYDDYAVRSLCSAAQLETFYQNMLELTCIWFGEQHHSDFTKQLEQYILSGGTYGTLSNHVVMRQVTTGSRWKNLLHRIFLPYSSMIIRYPILEKHKWLTPVFHVVRWFQLLTNGRIGSSLNELSHISRTTDQQISEAESILIQLGLKS